MYEVADIEMAQGRAPLPRLRVREPAFRGWSCYPWYEFPAYLDRRYQLWPRVVLWLLGVGLLRLPEALQEGVALPRRLHWRWLWPFCWYWPTEPQRQFARYGITEWASKRERAAYYGRRHPSPAYRELMWELQSRSWREREGA